MSAISCKITDLVCILGIVLSIRLMNSPKTARMGNLLGAACMLIAIATTMISNKIISMNILWVSLVAGAFIGCFLALHVTMTKIPQLVALLNGSGGAASAIIAFVVLIGSSAAISDIAKLTGNIALIVGSITFSGSLIAVAKLDGRMTSVPIILRGHFILNLLTLIGITILVPLVIISSSSATVILLALLILMSLIFGILFSIRVGGADMPIAVSLLNSLSGIAAATVGLAISNLLVVAVGAIVGSAGIVLTQIMCRSMNSSILRVLMGKTVLSASRKISHSAVGYVPYLQTSRDEPTEENISNALNKATAIIDAAQKIILVPGYGMALAQAQVQVKQLLNLLEAKGKQVKIAIHPVAGRMPGHMNVLLAEVEIPYDKLLPMEDINPEFKETDVALVVGANDVVNPAARTAEGTPIYGMPVLNVDDADYVIICNKDTCPGYAGVNNPLYLPRQNIILLLGDAAETLGTLLEQL